MKYYLALLILMLTACKSGNLISTNIQTINMVGYSELKVKPDISVISLNASARSDNKSEVVSQINQEVDSVITGIKTRNIRTDKIVINNLNIYWNYISEKEKDRKIEYSANQVIEIKMKFDVDEIEKIVQIVREIPRLNFNINFDISRPRRDSLENIVSRMAIEDAAKKAENIAAAANLRIIKILDITYQNDHPGAFLKSASMMSFAQDRSAERINLAPEDIQLNDNVKVTYLVRNK